MPAKTRTATILFTDVVGSTELAERLGPTVAEEVRGRHFAAMRGALAVHRGREVKTLGDGFMAVFDGSGDALACAVTMQQAVARHNRDYPDRSMQIRVGIGVGDVSEKEGDVFGMPVVLASRLCAAAGADQILVADVVRVLLGGASPHRFGETRALTLKGIAEPVDATDLAWDAEEGFALRVAVAEDNALMRQGLAMMLESEACEVVLQAADADELLGGLPVARPHAVVLDVRMPPTHTTEGLDAAQRIKDEYPGTGVLVLSASVQVSAARRLLSGETSGVGYLLKDLVGDAAELTAAIRTVASGGSAIAQEVVEQLAESA